MPSALDRPATRRQAGAVHAAFRRLGLGDPGWRDARLAIAGVLAGRADLGSVRELSGGEAGYLFRLLGSCRDARDLAIHLTWAFEDAQREAAGWTG